MPVSRRRLLSKAGLVAAGTVAAPAVASDAARGAATGLRVLVVGAHPDDPETGAGGIICRYVEEGHDVCVLYLTTGEAGIPGTSHGEAARIRRAEALSACRILGARPLFAGQIDGDSRVDGAAYADMARIVAGEKPDVILVHWPIDTHRDHRHCAVLVLDAWQRGDRRASLYYYEVMTGTQTQVFQPTHYVDVGRVLARKHDACFAHVSQGIRETYQEYHGRMEVFRGMEAGLAHAEALVHHPTSPAGRLPR